jgi:hypothetical protein
VKEGKMPNYVSKDGVWYPAKEKVGLVKKDGTPYVYSGEDRAALYELWQQKVETLGIDFRHDPDLLSRIKSLGFNDIDDYLKSIGYDKEAVEKNFKKNAAVVNKHELPARIAAIETMGGGTDTSGQGNDIPGGFGEPEKI